MSETLHTVIENYIASKSEKILQQEASDNEKEEYTNAVISKLEDRVYDEVKRDVRDKALAEAEKIIEKRSELRKIEELKKLTVEGLIVAFFVGLLVNQVTDMITFFKGTVTSSNFYVTIIIIFVLLFICISLTLGMLISQLLTLVRKDTHEND